MIEFVMPFYGSEAHLRSAVESVLAQTVDTWTLTVVDDAYPDPTAAAWVAHLGDPRVRLLRNPVNLGVNGNFQRCLEVATAEHVVFLGCDDVLLPSYVDVVGRAVEEHGCAMTQPGVQVIDEAGRVRANTTDSVKRALRQLHLARGAEDRHVLGGEGLATSLMHGNWTYFPAICWRRESITRARFSPGYDTILDLRLTCDLLLADESFCYVDEVAFQYRRHALSASVMAAADTHRFTEERRFFTSVAAQLDDKGWDRAARAARWHLSSRLHAGMQLPAAVRRPSAWRPLLHHLVRTD